MEVKIAQSRKNPDKKEYVQNVLELDKEMLREHLFDKKGRLFICGGYGMAKSVNAVIFKAIVLQCKVPYKGFTIATKLKQDKIIV